MNKDQFIKECKRINIEITEEQIEKLNMFYNLMIEWNEKINLTRIIEEKEVYLKHFYDSLTLNKVVNLKEVNTLCDVGTGAGFPGIVLKIVFPNLKITLIDSLQKRVNYLNNIIKSSCKYRKTSRLYNASGIKRRNFCCYEGKDRE